MSEPQTIGSYVLEERFAVGGMAEIFRARRRGPGGFDKLVALKRLLPDLNRDPEFVAMFLEEARLASQVASPNLVQVFDFGEAEGAHFLAMEYVDGMDLAALLATSRALPVDLALFAAIELCRGLEALHSATGSDGAPLGVVHRDVTPGNVLVSVRGEVKLGDFGIAKARARSLRTEKGSIKGKLAYLSPEQARGDEVDARSDLYAAGLVAFELLTGERYLASATEAQMLATAARPPARAASELRPEIPKDVDAVLRRALACEPGERFPDAARLRVALEGAASELKDAPRRLGELVRAAREGQAAPAPMAPISARAAPAPDPAAPVVATSPRTELLGAPAPRRSRAWIPAPLGLVVAACALAIWFAARPPVVVDAPPPAPLPQHAAPIAAAVEPPAPAIAPEPAPTPKPHAPARPTLTLAPRDPPVAKTAPTIEEPPPAPLPTQPARPNFDPELAALDRALSSRGLLPADAPELFAARRELSAALARGEAGAPEVDALRNRIESLALDRGFIEGKLKRLQAQLERSGVSEPARQEFLRRSQAALSQAVTGNYAQANKELNAVAAMLEQK